MILNDLATTVLDMGDGVGARDLHQQALALARQVRHPYEQARAHSGLAASLAADDPGAARGHWQRALETFEWMGVPERFEVGLRLAELDRSGDPPPRPETP